LKPPKVEFFRKGLAGRREKLGAQEEGTRAWPHCANSVYTLTEKLGCNLLYGVTRVVFFVGWRHVLFHTRGRVLAGVHCGFLKPSKVVARTITSFFLDKLFPRLGMPSWHGISAKEPHFL
jgi:hypothetical protein